MKECIGDAIRNAAMRFGVALDLWGKDELEQTTRGAEKLRAALADAPTSGERIANALGIDLAADCLANLPTKGES